MSEFEKKVTVNNVDYTFRLPTAEDMIQIDLKALSMRQGVTEGLGTAYDYSQSVARCETLCTEPKEPGFRKLSFYVLNAISNEVVNWLNSFRADVRKEQNGVGEGQG